MSTSTSDFKQSGWENVREGYWYTYGKDVEITIEKRPHYCDRGNWIAKVFTDIYPPAFDEQDGWPRYYFDLERAKLECEAWMKKRGLWV